MADINKKTLEHMAELGKIRVEEGDEEKWLKDFHKILSYFEELSEVDTEDVRSMDGGTKKTDVFREDEPRKNGNKQQERVKIVDSFPEGERGFLKVPAVFE